MNSSNSFDRVLVSPGFRARDRLPPVAFDPQTTDSGPHPPPDVPTTMPPLDQQNQRRKDEKLPLAILIHYNFYLSCIFAVLIGPLVFEKYRNYNFRNSLQSSLIVPMYCGWIIAEIPRLYVGQKSVLRDTLPEISSFLLISFFPQIWIAIYFSFLQELILPFDSVLGIMMIVLIAVEIVLAWRILRSMITRKYNQFYQSVG